MALKKIFRKSSPILKPNFDNIPDILKKYPFWGLWKGEKRPNGKLSKPPIDPRTGTLARVNDTNTFSSFVDAKKSYEAGEYDGVGILLTKEMKILGVDIDNCLSGKITTSQSKKIINELGTYAEKSPSGKGIRCIGLSDHPLTLEKNRKGNIELYTNNRFLTITGHVINSNKVRLCEKAFQKIHSELFDNKEKIQDDSGLDKIKQSALFKGDTAGFNSPSEADLALCRLIYQNGFTGSEEIDKVFRESELADKKWERQDYRDRTIDKAVSLEARFPYSTDLVIKLHDIENMISCPPPEIPCLIRDFIPKGQIGEMIGDGKIGKSSLLIQIAMVVASGISTEPFFVDSPKKVLVVNVEDPYEMIHQKIWHQSKQLNELNMELLAENLSVVDGHGRIGPLMRLDSDRNPERTNDGKKLEELIYDIKPDLVILDTKSRLYGLDENSNDHATQWLFHLERIARDVGCSFLIAHHTGKGQGKNTSRGASAFDNNTRFRFTLSPMTEGYGNKFKIDEGNLENYFTLACHSNYTAKRKIYCFKRGEAGIPILVNFAEQRWHKAEELLFELLNNKTVTRQQLKRKEGEDAKTIRDQLSEAHKITTKECETLLDNLEKKGRVAYEMTPRGKGKIISGHH